MRRIAVLASLVALGAALTIPSAQATQPAVQLSVTPSALSPNGDGIKERAHIRVVAKGSGELTVSVFHGGQNLLTLHSETLTAGGVALLWWNGRRFDGKPFPDGRYAIRAKLVPPSGPPATASAPVLLDTAPPVVSAPRLSPIRLLRGGLTMRARVAGLMPTVRLKVLLYDEDGVAVSSGPRVVVPTGQVRLEWHSAGRREPGAYRVALSSSDGLGNVSVSPQRPLLVSHAVHTRVWARFRGVGRHIALTFDDCNFPSAWTSILRTLRRFHVKATFFCPGQRVLAEPALARRTIAEGHAVGSHGWDHANFPTLSYGAQLSRLENDRDVWWRVAHAAATPYFRPPYGAYNASTLAAAGKAGYAATVLWDVDPRDWSSPGVGAIIQRVVSHTRPGSIVLMHVVPETAAALPAIISRLKARRFRPLTLPQLARIGRPSPGGWPTRGTGH